MVVKMWPTPGILKEYNSPLHPCWTCGRGVYRAEAIHDDGKYYHPETCYDAPQKKKAKMILVGPSY